jgi:branched-subunit amino acid aminotransferase/4-amino-4-deoxychorismate lyase
VIRLTGGALDAVHIARVMSSTNWLRKQVERLEQEIREDSIFETDTPPTREALRELREKVVVHTYLKQQLLRRETVRGDETKRKLFDTQEFALAHK